MGDDQKYGLWAYWLVAAKHAYGSLKWFGTDLLAAILTWFGADFVIYYTQGRKAASAIQTSTALSGIVPAILVFAVLFFVRLFFFAPVRLHREAQQEKTSLLAQIKELKAKIKPKLGIVFKPDGGQRWKQTQMAQEPAAHISNTGLLTTFRIAVINIGIETIRNVRVRLTDIDPSPPEPLGIPCHLHFMNDNVPPHAEQKDLPMTTDTDYKDALFVDVLWFWRGTQNMKMAICSIVNGVNPLVNPQPYRMTIAIASDNGGQPIVATLIFKIIEDGVPSVELVAQNAISS